MTEPVVSICLPTYNRVRYLRCLLESIVQGIGALKHPYELLVADNASTDDTESVVKEFTGRLNLRYFRREENHGPFDNQHFLKKQARGTLQLYLADDDELIFPELSAVVSQMLANPDIGVVYAPWKLYDRVSGTFHNNSYPLGRDFIIRQGDYESLLTLILQNHIFPEIYVIRSEIVRAAAAFTHPLAYYAFVQSAEYLSLTKVMFRKEPFYNSITRYFPDNEREQYGNVEVQDGWDRYRSGLEYIFSRIPPEALSQNQFLFYLMQIQKFISIRLNAALRLRIHGGRDPIDTYYLACRLKAMGFPQMIPIPFDEIRYQAAAHYVLTGGSPSDNIDKLIYTGELPRPLYRALIARCRMAIINVQGYIPAQFPNAVVLIPGTMRNATIDHQALAAHHIRMIAVDDLLQKFT